MPNCVKQALAREYAPGMRCEEFNQPKFRGSGDRRFIAHGKPHGRSVNHDIARANRLFFQWLLKTPQYRFHAGHDLFWTEGFCNVIIGANFKAPQAVGFRSSRRHENDWDTRQRGIITHRLRHIQSAVARHHDVENHQRGSARVHLFNKSSASRKP